MSFDQILLVYTKPCSSNEKSLLASVQTLLKKQKQKFVSIERQKLLCSHFKKKDLVLTVGGDGTFLFARQLNDKNLPILGINADMSRKEGFLLGLNKKTLHKLPQILTGKYSVKELPVLQATVNDKKLPVTALNEFFFGSPKAYTTSRYAIRVKGKEEVHRSSGVIVATPVGVNAWASSAYGKKIILKDNHFAFVVREPYEQKVFSKYKHKKGILKQKEHLTLTCKMEGAILIADSLSKEYTIPLKAKIKIGCATKKVRSLFP